MKKQKWASGFVLGMVGLASYAAAMGRNPDNRDRNAPNPPETLGNTGVGTPGNVGVGTQGPGTGAPGNTGFGTRGTNTGVGTTGNPIGNPSPSGTGTRNEIRDSGDIPGTTDGAR